MRANPDKIDWAIEEFPDQISPFRVAPGVQVESWLGGMITPIALPLVW